MPSRFKNRSTALFGLVVLSAALIGAPALAQQLTLPSDLTGGAITAPTHTDPLRGGTVMHDGAATQAGMVEGGVTPLGPDATMVHGAPVSAMSSGQYYNPTLGSHIRARYNTQSYGQQEGQLDLGTMKLMAVDGGMAFLDGQVTLNEESGVGYNVGLGYRWMTLPLFPWSPDDEKIMGVSIWSDGQTIGKENFFNQVGVSLEFLGEHLDFRANGYAPVGPRNQTRDFFENGEFGYTGNFLGRQLVGVRDTALTVGEAELAGRLGDLDAWAFAGVYGFAGGPYDAVGGKLGLRGYATPDLLLSIAVANDDQFDTNALFSATWFIGRTRAENCPTGVLQDRMREPVIRNTYIATEQSVAFSVGEALRSPDGELIRLTHVNSNAAPGGDGTFERPLNAMADLFDNSLDDDIVLSHAGSVYTAPGMARDGQQLFSEGADMEFTVATISDGDVILPESRAGARGGAISRFEGTAGMTSLTLSDNNLVQNFAFNAGQTAIANDAVNGSDNATLRDLTITGTTGDAIALTTVVTDDPDTDTTDTVNVMGTVTIEDIAFNNIGGRDIAIDADATGADVTTGETINIARVTSSGNTGGPSIDIRNTNPATAGSGPTTITDYSYENGVGGLLLTNTGSNVVVTESDFTGGTGPAVQIEGSQSTSTITVGATNTITDITGDAVVINANEGVVNADADIATANTVDGGNIRITANEGAVNARGNHQANNSNAVTILNAKGDINIGSAFDATTGDGTLVHTGTGDAISITDDTTDADTSSVVGITINSNIDNDGGQSVVVNGGNDDIQFTGDLDDSAAGIRVSNLDAPDAGTPNSSSVRFGPNVTLNTGDNDAVVLGGGGAATANDDGSTVEFQNLEITTGMGRGLVSNGGVLNVDDATPTSTITTGSGQAIAITGGSSTTGVNFASVDTTNPNNAVTVTDFDGTVDINGGTLATQQRAVEVRDATVLLDGVNINSANDQAIRGRFTDDQARTLSVNNMNANGGDFDYATSGTASTAVTVSDVTNGGEIRFAGGASVDDTLAVTNAAFVDGFGYTATGTGGLNVVMDDGTGTLTGGAVSFNSSGSGNSSLQVNDLVSTGSFSYTSSAAGTLDVDMTDVTSTGAGVVGFNSNGSGNNTLDITDSGSVANPLGPFSYNVTGAGDLAVTMTDVQGSGATTMNVTGAGDGSVTMDGVTSTGGFDFDTSGAGNVTVNMTDVTGVGATTLDTTGDGNASLTATNLNTGGALTATGSAASTGDLSVSTTNSGNTTAFTSVRVNQQGTGTALGTFNNTSSATGIDFDSASDTLSSLNVTGGDYGNAAIAFDETGDGDASVSLTNVANVTSVTVNEGGDGNASLTMSGETYDGAITLNETGDGNAIANLSGNVTSTAGFTLNEAGDGNASLTMTGATFGGDIVFDELGAGTATSNLTGVTTTGAVTFTSNGDGNKTFTAINSTIGGVISATAGAGSTDDFTARVSGGTFTGDQIVFNAQNAGDVTYEVNDISNFSTGGDDRAIDLTVGSNVQIANIRVTAVTGVQTADNNALALTLGADDVNFLLDGSSFTNNSSLDQTVLITNNNGTTLNSTITGNTLTNTDSGDELLLFNNTGAQNNLLVDGNGPAGAQYTFTNDGTMRVRGDNAGAVDGANDGTITFNGTNAPIFDNNLTVPQPPAN